MTTTNVTERSSKAEIIDLSCEVIDTQQEKISQLKQQQTTLSITLGVVALWGLLF